ncbi:MAG TPA: metallophosphoesterase [Candidatus Avimonas sp.]|mgnify:FL=1|jgi:predicted MPP superfamily phosphohydrolase|nr:metallophosphoesterase [Candidatus Avimonas sp.]HQA15486.1 metallophosphoesterase [Candidatus Avimonas sp.]HQD37516.1 metallophosphoesterase [Candidatus Avimonas sp.]
MSKNSKKRRLARSAVLAAALGALLVADNIRVEVEKIQVDLDKLPAEFNGFCIAHLSDLHLPNCVRRPDRLVEVVRKINPDIIALTGDLVDRFSRFDAGGLRALAQGLAGIAPCYAVTGNHEMMSGAVGEWNSILKSAGVTVLGKSPVLIRRGEAEISLVGLPDGRVYGLTDYEKDAVCVALSHYPENIAEYADFGFDLVLSGHAHGGQWRLGRRGLVSPGQGLLPKYTSGLYAAGDTKMVVSRGLRNGVPVRIFNSPHIPVVILKSGGE